MSINVQHAAKTLCGILRGYPEDSRQAAAERLIGGLVAKVSDVELQDALDAWRGLTEKEREEVIDDTERIAAGDEIGPGDPGCIYRPAQIAARLLKAAAR